MVNTLIEWYSVDNSISWQLDDKIEEFNYILHEASQDEKDLFIHKFYKEELSQRFLYVANTKGKEHVDYMTSKLEEFNSDWITMFELEVRPDLRRQP